MESVDFLLISLDDRPLAVASCEGIILCVVQDLQQCIFGLSPQALLHHSIASVIHTAHCGDILQHFMNRIVDGEDFPRCELVTK